MTRREFVKGITASASAFALWPACAQDASQHKFILSAPLTHSDWMLKPNVEWGPAGVRHMLDQCKECGWSHVHWRVLDGGRSLYRSKLMRPMGKWDADSFWSPQTETDKALFRRFTSNMNEARRLTMLKTFEALDYSTFDPLAEAVRYGHEIGLQIHAWVTINEDDHGWGLQSEFSKLHPKFRWRGRNGKTYRSQLSFAFPEVRRYKLAILKELLSHYSLDGLFLDWIRTGDVRDNPQNDADGVADFGYEQPLVDRCKRKLGRNAADLANNDNAWVRLRAEPQTEFMREVRKLVRKQKHPLPVAAMIGHPWHYRGELNKIDGNLRGLLLDVTTWAREGLIDAIVAAGYYRDGGDAEKAALALRKETESKVDVWTYGWVPNSVADAEQTFGTAERVGVKQILFWEADYIDDRPNATELKKAMRDRASGTQ